MAEQRWHNGVEWVEGTPPDEESDLPEVWKQAAVYGDAVKLSFAEGGLLSDAPLDPDLLELENCEYPCCDYCEGGELDE